MQKTVIDILKTRDFINVASADGKGRPNGVSKLIISVNENSLVVVDYAIGRTYANLRANPRLSLSFFDLDSLKGYQLYGPVEIIEEGADYEEMKSLLSVKEVRLSTERIIRGMTRGKGHDQYELGRAQRKFVFFRVRIEEIVEVSYSGEVKRDHPETA